MEALQATDILYFQRYLFTDTGEEAPHFGLLIIPAEHTAFKESLLCAVMTSQPVRSNYGTYKLSATNYSALSRDTTIRFRDLDYVPKSGLSPRHTQPVGNMTKSDVAKAFAVLKSVLYGTASPIGADYYLMATIIREWKKKR